MNTLPLGRIILRYEGWLYMVIDKDSYDGTIDEMHMICYRHGCCIHACDPYFTGPFASFMQAHEVKWVFMADRKNHEDNFNTMIMASDFHYIVLTKRKGPNMSETLITTT